MAVRNEMQGRIASRPQAYQYGGASLATQPIAIANVVTKAAGDSDGSIVGLAVLPQQGVFRNLRLSNAALTGATDVDVGLGYTVDGRTVKELTTPVLLVDGTSLASARAVGSELNLLAGVAVADRLKQVYEMLGDSLPNVHAMPVLYIKFNTAGSAAGAICVDGDLMNVA